MKTSTSFTKGHQSYPQVGKNNGRYTHGMKQTRQYGIWLAMKARCDRKTTINYKWYGGKGIGYDPKWSDFKLFWEDMENGYNDSLTLDRIDSTKNYNKENCRWISQQEQLYNTSRNRRATFSGKTQTFTEWEKELGFKRGVIRQRVDTYGWPVEKALTKPLRNKRK